MHSIERYGIVALLFLVVTVVAVLMWDGGKKKEKPKLSAGLRAAASESVEPAVSPRSETERAERRLSLVADSQPGPLLREGRAAAPSAESPGDTGNLAEPLTVEEPPTRALDDATLTPRAAAFEPVREPVIGAKTSAEGRTYVVRSGDTLSEIAQRELGSSKRWRELVAANPGLDPARLGVGKRIRIPGAGAAHAAPVSASEPARKSPSRPSAAEKPAASGKTWTVGAGESLWRIAEKALGDGKRWREIAALNPKVNPDRLSAGTVLVLPAGAASKAAPPRSSPAKKPAAPVVASSRVSERSTRGGGRVR